ncbi:IucA/IucC family C-terminal-domain containing protein [Plantactinospora sp. KLBMP9567]|uniref:IucA/IucC family C-terminal-domain containing protein n=1 Tax=Plantactinospora sp. KLBMP9567 TaxID=3085900 RepID=UPI002981EDCB|nr:IucA/IucC family C-terminal-domain containing protein [Plantactinospora sp. KLBMP9567]MDW5327213.1 IucA/IucC family C-terminal-domain containing protein [Plantactinospora sp. KLBMP9567]
MIGDRAAAPLAPVTATLRAAFGTDELPGLATGLLVSDETGWAPATELVDGTRLPELLAVTRHRWGATSHTAAALAWKSYTYWLLLPVVLGWASARRVPLLRPDDVLVRFEDHRPLLTLGMRRSTEIAVLPSDPLALSGLPEVRVVLGEAELLAALRASLLDAHLTPMLDSLHQQVRVGTRTLLGSVASGVAHGVLRAADTLPGGSAETIGALLDTLGVADLVDLVPGPTGELTVQRKTCCLAFTLPQPKVCAGCCIRTS